MKFPILVSTLATLPCFAIAQISTRATCDPIYDNADTCTNTVACGSQLSGRFPTFGSLPAFPKIGGSEFIANFDSTPCGSCWRIELPGSNESHILLLAVDIAADGFNITEEAMPELAGQDGINNGSISINYGIISLAKTSKTAMPQALDYSTNVYLAIELVPTSVYTMHPIVLDAFPSVADIGQVGELQDTKLLSIPKDVWRESGQDILDILRNNEDNVLRVIEQEPKLRKKRGADEL